MDRDLAAITRGVAAELRRPVPPEAGLVADHVRRRYGSAVAGVLYYGSCLRTGRTADSVLDFYVLVDSYRAAYRSRALAWSNAILPPNVFYAELGRRPGRPVRTKYAIMTTEDFGRAASSKTLHSIVWSRFSQPALLVYARDRRARAAAERASVNALLTMVAHMLAFLPRPKKGSLVFSAEDLWQSGFRETYRGEFRPEREATIRSVYEADRGRYDALTGPALRVLERRGWLRLVQDGSGYEVRMPPRRREALLARWRIRRPLTKALQFPRLIKSAITFGDWVPYALFKIHRHTGILIEPSERQLRHPFIWGWPILFRLLREQALR
jgi:hypothetical protein